MWYSILRQKKALNSKIVCETLPHHCSGSWKVKGAASSQLLLLKQIKTTQVVKHYLLPAAWVKAFWNYGTLILPEQIKFKLNKKVLLRERKRHTARCVASTRYAGLVGTPATGGGVPPAWIWMGGAPCPGTGGTPGTQSALDGVAKVPPHQLDGVPPLPGPGVPHFHFEIANDWLWLGVPWGTPPSAGWGIPPSAGWGTPPPHHQLDGVPPPTIGKDKGTPQSMTWKGGTPLS